MGIAGAQTADPVLESTIIEQGGQLAINSGDPTLATFDDPAAALRACGVLRSRLKEGAASGRASAAFALHYCELTEPGDSFGPNDLSRLEDLLEATPSGEIYASSQFFNKARRNSPYFFDDLSGRAEQTLQGVFRVSRPMNRQPFLAVYTNPAPRREKRACSLAVAPIKVVGQDSECGYWADGLTEDLILELSRTRRVEVSSRTTLFAIRSHDAVEIGQELGVGYVLFGSFRKLGTTARLTFTLADTDTGNVIWSERFTADFDEIFALIDDIVAKVVARIAGKIEHSEIEAARVKRPENMTAYEFYLRGVWHHRLGGVTEKHSRKAVEFFEKAIEADPNFHRPHAMLVCAMSDLPEFDSERADRIAIEAYEADPSDPELNRIMAWVKFTRGEFDMGIGHAERSVELAPHDAYLLGRCAVMHIFNGDPETGLARLRRAVLLDPFVPVYIVEEFLTAYYVMGDYEKVIAEARSLHHQTRRSRYYAAASQVALGQLDAACKIIEAALSDDASLSLNYVRGQELFRDQAIMNKLLDRLTRAGLPE